MAAKKLGDGDADPVALYDDFAPGDRSIIGQHHDGVVLAGIELDDRSATHAQKLVHRNDRAAQNDGDFNRDAFDVRGHEARLEMTQRDLPRLCFPWS